MPRVLRTSEETENGFIRPVVFDVLRRIFKETGLNPKTTRIAYPGGDEVNLQFGSAIEQETKPVEFGYSDKLFITVQENYVEDRLLSTAIHRVENIPIFLDERLSINLRPIYAPTTYNVSVKYRGADKPSVERWRDDIKNRVSLSRLERFYDVKYHYLIPEEIEVVLRELHRLREAVAGYGETYEQYLAHYGSKRLTIVTDQAGKNTRRAFEETQRRVQGWFDFTGVPEQLSKEGDADAWGISFNYYFNLDKPLGVVFNYPVSVHQQMLSDYYRPGPDEYPIEDPYRFATDYTLSGSYFRHFEAGLEPSLQDLQPGYTVPRFDDWIPGLVPGFTRRLWTALVSVTVQDRRNLVNLLDFKDLRYDPDLIPLLKKEAPFMHVPYRSIFVLSVYKDFVPLDPWLIEVDADLNVRALEDLDLRSQYRVRLSIVTDLSKLPKDVWDRIRVDTGPGLIKIIDAIDPTLKNQGKLPGTIGDGVVPKKDIDEAIKAIEKNRAWEDTYQMRTVETLIIKAGHLNATH